MKTVSFYTLGCRVNQYEIRAIREIFIKGGYSVLPFGKRADVCVINTCAVTGESEKKSRHVINRASRFSDRVLVTGCFAKLIKDGENYPENVVFCGGNIKKGEILNLMEGKDTGSFEQTIYEELSVGTATSLLKDQRYRAYVKIQDGCDGNCAYCIIPKLRGPSRIRNEENIIEEVKRLALSGVTEIILTGIEVSDYGTSNLCRLIKRVEEAEGIRRIRLGSINPNTLTDEFIQTVSESQKFCRHLHLSVQSGCGRILNLMRRPYSAEKLQKCIDKLYEVIPGMLLSADIISSFPTETEEEFNRTLEFIRKNRFMHIHAFSYSPRPLTEAADLDGQIPEKIKKDRNLRVIALSDECKEQVAEGFIGSAVEILIEENKKGNTYGHTGEFMEAKIPGLFLNAGDYVNCIVTEYDKEEKTLVCKIQKYGEAE